MVAMPGVPRGTHEPRERLPDAFTPPVPDSGARHVGFPRAQVSPAASTGPRGGGHKPRSQAEGTGGSGPAQGGLG